MKQPLIRLKEATDFLLSHMESPEIGLILGSGLGDFVNQIIEQTIIPYKEIPHFPISTVIGHASQLVAGEIAGKKVLAMQGRFHYYEGYSMSQVTFPVRVMGELGVKTLIITNAAGGLNPSFRPGDIMLISDHINFLGVNPLRGPNVPEWGPRFPDMTEAYDAFLRETAKSAAQSVQQVLREGIYVWIGGPSYETPAEVKFLRLLGADAVGMSTVPEVIVANHCGLKVLGLSLITNVAAGMGRGKLFHKDVIATAHQGKNNFQKLVTKIVELI